MMAIPTPKTPQNRGSTQESSTVESTTHKKLPVKQENNNGKPLTSKKLPTPPTRPSHLKKHTTSSTDTLSTIISVLIVLCVGIGVWTYRGPIANYLESLGLRGTDYQAVQDTNALFVGKEVQFDGVMTQEKNKHYTHGFVHPTYGKIGLRSTTINLTTYTGELHLQGQVVDFVDSMYIVELSMVTPITSDTEINTGEYVSGLTYFSDARTIFNDMSTEHITVSKSTDTPNIFILTNTLTNATVTIRYFTCDNTPSHDCKRFTEGFKNSVGIDFADGFGNVFYRLSDANTWFVSLEDKIGMYLETTDPAMIPLVIKNTQFVTNNRATKKFTNDIVAKICQSSDTTLVGPSTISLVSHYGEPAVSVVTSSSTCLIEIDPNNSLGGKLISLSGSKPTLTGTTNTIVDADQTTSNTSEEDTTSSESPVIVSNLSTTDTPQIPLKPGKEIKFVSQSAGYTLVFPSPSVSYGSFSVTEKIAGLSCRIGTRIIGYTNKVNLATNPSLIIYGCKKGTPQLASNMLSFDAKDTTFIVQVNDKAWINFANNIKVE